MQKLSDDQKRINKIESQAKYTNVVGLPLRLLYRLLSELGLDLADLR